MFNGGRGPIATPPRPAPAPRPVISRLAAAITHTGQAVGHASRAVAPAPVMTRPPRTVPTRAATSNPSPLHATRPRVAATRHAAAPPYSHAVAELLARATVGEYQPSQRPFMLPLDPINTSEVPQFLAQPQPRMPNVVLEDGWRREFPTGPDRLAPLVPMGDKAVGHRVPKPLGLAVPGMKTRLADTPPPRVPPIHLPRFRGKFYA